MLCSEIVPFASTVHVASPHSGDMGMRSQGRAWGSNRMECTASLAVGSHVSGVSDQSVKSADCLPSCGGHA